MGIERGRGGSGRSQRSISNDVRYDYNQKPLGVKIKNCCRSTIAFVFSNVGVCGLMVGYTIMGSFLFMSIEGTHEEKKMYDPEACRANVTDSIWNYTLFHNTFDHESWKHNVTNELESYQHCIHRLLREGWDGVTPNGTQKWSFEGGFLYSLTVITTIGYGHICPVTDIGKIVTIVYTIFGMPVFLLYLANMGNILAKSLKWTYAKVCICRIGRIPQYDPGSAFRSAEAVLRGPVGANFLPSHYDDRDSYEEDYDLRGIPSISSAVDRHNGIRSGPYLRKPYDPMDQEEEFHSSSGLDEISYASQGSYHGDKTDPTSINIPIKVSLIIMISLLYGGTFLFDGEDWDFLTAFYFCFISLTTIGFGDYVPGDSLRAKGSEDKKRFIYCSLYLMFGLAILSMCFNLMQEKLVSRVNSCMKKLSLSKENEPD